MKLRKMGIPRRRRPPEPIYGDGVIGIPLTRGKVAWIDPADLPIVAPYIWRACPKRNTCYAIANVNGHTRTMHRLILNPPKGLEPDHIDGIGTHNFRWNLRAVTHQENMKNNRKARLLHRMIEERLKDYEDGTR